MELSDNELTLNNVIRIFKQVELTHSHIKNLDEERNVNQYNNSQNVHQHYTPQGRDQWKSKPQCPKCMCHHDATWCRADNAICSACGQYGPFMKSALCSLQSNHGQGQGCGRGRGHGRSQMSNRNGHQTDDYPAEQKGEDDVEYEEEQFVNVL